MTGSDDSETERRGLEAGASDFIRKPFNKDILVRRIYNTIMNDKVIETLRDEASVDKLTGFWSRAAGIRRLSELCKSCEGMLMILDLDNFKLVNDLHGHDTGDRILETFAGVVRNNTRANDVVARIGGDEFAAFFCNMKEDAPLGAITERLNKQFVEASAKYLGEDSDIPLGISVGAVAVPAHGTNYEELFPLADSALYRAKHNGKHGHVLYAEENDLEISREEDLQTEMDRITKIVEGRGDKGGALLLGLDQFSAIYQFSQRHAARKGGMSCKLLFNLSPEKGTDRKKVSEQFGECLQKVLRRSDIILNNKINQYFLYLPDLAEENVPVVLERIMKAWETYSFAGHVAIEHVVEPLSYEGRVVNRPADSKDERK
ncbi:diguanylate cyclase domain-containing protein [Anaerovibrio sp. RM50]|uniref:diguanylate cyclase domain-containing protein n=1 Tax=Anaerovibrio sp. RM50 TaxID=1200557 RepID=UPI000480D530|nr:diguanylate cyclase [Anaerovibrio sp. RM50]